MAKRESVFSNEWRRCLREHYQYVIRNQDKATEHTLTPILHRFGFTEDELRQLYLQATLRADDLPADFVPDLARVMGSASSTTPEPTFQTHPQECSCPSCMNLVLEQNHDTDGQPVAPPAEPEEPAGNIFPVVKPAAPKQKSLF